MYPCTKCSRVYRTHNSLTRHSHSHKQTKKHQCSTCGVVFYRKDLLSRHSKLHRTSSPNTAQPLDSNGDASNASGRQRCHTACLRCRECRTKCDGKHPCRTCQKANFTCEYSRRSNRLSHTFRDTAAPTVNLSHKPDGQDDLLNNVESMYQQHTMTAEGGRSWEGDELHCGTHDLGEGSRHLQHVYNAYPDCSLVDMPLSFDNPAPLINSGETSAVDSVSWPWLHENLFLPADPASFANIANSVDFSYYRDDDLLGIELEPPTNNDLLQADTHATHPNPNATFCQTTEPAFTRTASQNQAFMADDHNPTSTLRPTATSSNNTSMRISSSNPEGILTTREKQSLVVRDLIALASTLPHETKPCQTRAEFWEAASTKIEAAFGLSHEEGQSRPPALHKFCIKYTEHFGQLWPLLSRQTLDLDALHPLLYLVLTSIGSMYCGSNASNYGTMMHASIRTSLTMALELESDDPDLTWLAQARLLTQVAALYFGQPKAFTYAHHLGGLLVAQARRMDLFSSAHSDKTIQLFHRMKGIASDEDRIKVWLQLETRRRLAFGIFRGDTYTSVLLHTKPLLSMEEIDLQMPMCDAVWRGDKMSASLCLQMLEHDQTPGRELWASDIYRIAMDQNEQLPPLDPAGLELLLFGLQYPIWRFSKDQEMFARLTGGFEDPADPDSVITSLDYTQDTLGIRRVSGHPSKSTIRSEAHCLDSSVRQMEGLRRERRRLLSALRKWEQSLPLVKTFIRTHLDRSCLMSGLILFHLGYLQLNVPLESLHQIQYRLADNRVVEDDLITAVRKWANSPQGRLAAERACNIWTIIKRETQLEKVKQVNFNLLAFIGLHHGAVLLWAYAGAVNSTENTAPDMPLFILEGSDATAVTESQSTKMLSSFVDLYDCISPARWSSFAKAASTLSRKQFPQPALQKYNSRGLSNLQSVFGGSRYLIHGFDSLDLVA